MLSNESKRLSIFEKFSGYKGHYLGKYINHIAEYYEKSDIWGVLMHIVSDGFVASDEGKKEAERVLSEIKAEISDGFVTKLTDEQIARLDGVIEKYPLLGSEISKSAEKLMTERINELREYTKEAYETNSVWFVASEAMKKLDRDKLTEAQRRITEAMYGKPEDGVFDFDANIPAEYESEYGYIRELVDISGQLADEFYATEDGLLAEESEVNADYFVIDEGVFFNFDDDEAVDGDFRALLDNVLNALNSLTGDILADKEQACFSEYFIE